MKSIVFVGGYDNSIELFDFLCDADGGNVVLKHLRSSETDANPSFVAIDGDHLYCVHEVSKYKGKNTGGVSFLKFDGCNLITQQSQNSAGKDPTHISLDAKRKCIYVSNYSSGHFSVTSINDDGHLGHDLYTKCYDDGTGNNEVTGSGVDPDRQISSHPHGAFARGRFVYVVDLGCDKIYHYEHSDGGNTFRPASPAFTVTPPGSGPRHMSFHPTYDLAFLVTELSNNVIVFRHDKKDGSLMLVHSYSFLTDHDTGKNYGAEIMVHPNGNYLYLSNRVTGYLISYKILNQGGELEKLETVALQMTWPRHFTIHSSGKVLLCAGQHTNKMEVFSINDSSGKLHRIETVECNNNPSCIVFKDIK